jgi:hypothetical protein
MAGRGNSAKLNLGAPAGMAAPVVAPLHARVSCCLAYPVSLFTASVYSSPERVGPSCLCEVCLRPLPQLPVLPCVGGVATVGQQLRKCAPVHPWPHEKPLPCWTEPRRSRASRRTPPAPRQARSEGRRYSSALADIQGVHTSVGLPPEVRRLGCLACSLRACSCSWRRKSSPVTSSNVCRSAGQYLHEPCLAHSTSVAVLDVLELAPAVIDGARSRAHLRVGCSASSVWAAWLRSGRGPVASHGAGLMPWRLPSHTHTRELSDGRWFGIVWQSHCKGFFAAERNRSAIPPPWGTV